MDSFINSFIGKEFDVATIITEINSNEELLTPSVVKVALSKDNYTIYFSRSPIPYLRDSETDSWLINFKFWKHIGIYAYKSKSLKRCVDCLFLIGKC